MLEMEIPFKNYKWILWHILFYSLYFTFSTLLFCCTSFPKLEVDLTVGKATVFDVVNLVFESIFLTILFSLLLSSFSLSSSDVSLLSIKLY